MKVLLLGDSIRIGAQFYLNTYLPDDWTVLSPCENCGTSNNIKKKLDGWDIGADIVHINCGLHDIRFLEGTDHPVVGLEEYQANLESIFIRLKTKGCRVVWGTTTPFNETVLNAYAESFSCGDRRYERDLYRYNDVSRSIALKHKVRINDIFLKLTELDTTPLFFEDALHFNDDGNNVIGQLISESLLESIE